MSETLERPEAGGRPPPFGLAKQSVRPRSRALLSALRHDFTDALDQRRLLVALPFAFMLGGGLYCFLPAEPQLWALWPMAFGLVAACFAARHRINMMRGIVLLTVTAMGLALPATHARLFGTGMIGWPGVADISGTVERVRGAGTARQTVYVALEDVEESWLVDVRKLRLNVDDAAPILNGSAFAGRVRLYPVPGPVAPGAYDPQFHDFFDGIGAYGAALDPPRIIPPAQGLTSVVASTRALIVERIHAALPPDQSAIAVALTVGDQSGIPDEVRDRLATAGLAHVLAISGLHLSIVAGLVFLLVRLGFALATGADRWAVKSGAAAAALMVAFAYMLISGGGVATVRATIMLALLLGAVMLGRQALTMRNVAFAALAILILSPTEFLRPGFQLSFSAVVALIGCYEYLSSRRRDAGPPAGGTVLRYVGGLALTSLIAGIATAPFAAFHFQQFAPLGLFANLVAVPIAGFLVLPAALAAVLMIPFGIDAVGWQVMGLGISVVLNVAFATADLTGGLAHAPELGWLAIAAMGAGLAWFAFLRSALRFAGPIIAGLVMLVAGPVPGPDVIVSDSTQAVALRTGEDGSLRLLGSNRTSFAVRAWEERYGAELDNAEPVGLCDRQGCIGAVEGRTVAVTRTYAAAAEECGQVDLLIARGGSPSHCPSTVSRALLEDGGALAIYVEAKGWRLRPAITDPGRPWRGGSRQ